MPKPNLRLRYFGTDAELPEEDGPLAELLDDIARSSAFNEITEFLTHAQSLGLDLGDPDVVRRAIAAGIKAHEGSQQAARHISPASEPRRNALHTPVVYYMRMGDLIKIGTTSSIADRMKEIRPQGVLAVEPGGRQLERSRHHEFATTRQHGEWFRLDRKLADHLAAVRDAFEKQHRQTVESWVEQNLRAHRELVSSRVAMTAPARWLDAVAAEQSGLVYASQAARARGISRGHFDQWRRKGKIRPVALAASGRKLYSLADVFAVSARRL